MIPARISPAGLFAKLFLSGKPEEIREQQRRLDDGKSILDHLGSQAKALKALSSANASRILDDYFESIRSTESNIAVAKRWIEVPKPQVDAPAPGDIADHADLIGRVQLLMDLVPLIVQSDSSRVVTIFVQDHTVVPKV